MSKETKTYVAYGSNMDLRQMAWRCPGATPMGTGALLEHRLLFKGSKTGSYATVEPFEGAEVPVLLWEIGPEDERSLDRYEGFPDFYQKREVAVETEGGEVTAMAYVMRVDASCGAPGEWYYGVLERAYELFGFDKAILEKALDDSLEEELRKAV